MQRENIKQNLQRFPNLSMRNPARITTTAFLLITERSFSLISHFSAFSQWNQCINVLTSKHRWHREDCTAEGSSPVPPHSPLSRWSPSHWDTSGSVEKQQSNIKNNISLSLLIIKSCNIDAICKQRCLLLTPWNWSCNTLGMSKQK